MHTVQSLLVVLIAGTLAGCGSDASDDEALSGSSAADPSSPHAVADDDAEPVGDDASPPDDVPDAVTTRAPFGETLEVPVERLAPDGIARAVPLAVSADGARVLLEASDAGYIGSTYLSYDVAADRFSTLPVPEGARNAAFDADWNTATWAASCIGYAQRLEAMSEPLVLNPLLRDAACVDFNPVGVSDDGDTLLIRTNLGRELSDGSLAFDGGSGAQAYNAVAVVLSSGTVTSLASDDLVLDDPALDGLHNLAFDWSLGADGRHVVSQLYSTAARAESTPTCPTGAFFMGTLLVDTVTGEARVLDKRRFPGPLGEGCTFPKLAPPRLSADGRYALYQQPVEEPASASGGELGTYRRELTTGDTVRVASGRPTLQLVASRDAGRAAWLTIDGDRGLDPSVAYFDVDGAPRTLSLRDALRFCEAGSCLYDRVEPAPSELPLTLSADGTSLAISARTFTTDGPDEVGRLESFHFDLDTGALTRLSPDAPGEARAMDARGELLVQLLDGAAGARRVSLVRRSASSLDPIERDR